MKEILDWTLITVPNKHSDSVGEQIGQVQTSQEGARIVLIYNKINKFSDTVFFTLVHLLTTYHRVVNQTQREVPYPCHPLVMSVGRVGQVFQRFAIYLDTLSFKTKNFLTKEENSLKDYLWFTYDKSDKYDLLWPQGNFMD